MDKKTGEKSKTRPRFVKQDQVAIMRLEATGVICMELFKNYPQLGRFTLRDEGMPLLPLCFLSFCLTSKLMAVDIIVSLIQQFFCYRKNNRSRKGVKSNRKRKRTSKIAVREELE